VWPLVPQWTAWPCWCFLIVTQYTFLLPAVKLIYAHLRKNVSRRDGINITCTVCGRENRYVETEREREPELFFCYCVRMYLWFCINGNHIILLPATRRKYSLRLFVHNRTLCEYISPSCCTRYYYIGVAPYPRVIHSKTYRGYMKPRIIPNAISNVIFV
jgi:hypothetical protein